MSHDQNRRSSSVPYASPASIPNAPPLPAPKPLQRAKDAAYRFIGYPASQPPIAHDGLLKDRFQGSINGGRFASLGASQNATASHKTGLEINTIAINEAGTHALIGGNEIFKTVKVENGACVEELNLRTAIRSTPTQASGRPRQTYSIDIADVAWAKGDFGDYVAAATSSGKIILYDLGHAGLQAAQLHEHFRQVHKVTFNPHRGNLLLSGSQDGTVRLWDVRDARNHASTLQSKRKYSGQSDGVRDVKWSPTEGVDFAFGTDSGWIQRWDMRNLKAAKVKIPAHTLSCNIIDWHPDGKHIASASSDKTVRFWDFSAQRRGKAAWEIRTPYPVLNARWRPACESSMPTDNGARQCTQLVTGYDREHPVLHIWDFQRPFLPFREMVPYPSAPTDLLWHSQDLLWTVGREGVFLQSGIQHAPNVIDKRNLQSFAVSPKGEVSFVVQKRRQQRRTPHLYHHHASTKISTSTSTPNNNLSTSHETIFISRSWQDDSLDHSLNIRPEKHHKRSTSGAKTPSGTQSTRLPILSLDQILHNRKSFSPQQHAVRGFLPYHTDSNVFCFLAKNYSHNWNLTIPIDQHLLDMVKKAFERNHNVAETAGLYRLAQTWKIVGFATINHLQARAKLSGTMTGADAAVSTGSSPKASISNGDEGGSRAGQDQTHFDEAESPFTLGEMLHKLLEHHTASGDAQTSMQLVTLLVPLLPRSDTLSEETEKHLGLYADVLACAGFSHEEIAAILDKDLKNVALTGFHPLQVESILSTYHEQLMAHQLFVDAAFLRNLAYPAHPAVYEGAMTNNHVYLKCSECGKPIESGMAKLKCESCGTKMAPCPYCWESTSPFGGGKLMTTCLKCNHSMHAGCLREWFVNGDGDGCAAEGCLCNCGKA